MNAANVRHVEPSDYPQIIAVVDDWWGGRPMAAMLPRFFFVHFRRTSFVVEISGEIVAFLVGFVSPSLPHEAYIHFVGVHPQFRKNGLARTLYECFIATVYNLGCRSVRSVTSPVNKGSIRFHFGLGFRAIESEKFVAGIPVVEEYDGIGEDRVLFVKNL
jgi:ribosomal protein S18 acetylase RimI-like enzyme